VEGAVWGTLSTPEYDHAQGKWRARIGHEGKKREMGLYETEEEVSPAPPPRSRDIPPLTMGRHISLLQAARGYDLEALRLQGPKAVTNFAYDLRLDAQGHLVAVSDKATGCLFPLTNPDELMRRRQPTPTEHSRPMDTPRLEARRLERRPSGHSSSFQSYNGGHAGREGQSFGGDAGQSLKAPPRLPRMCDSL
jgi:hypothetical protein